MISKISNIHVFHAISMYRYVQTAESYIEIVAHYMHLVFINQLTSEV